VSERGRLAVPGPGRTIAASAEVRASHVRAAVSVLADAFADSNPKGEFEALFGPRWSAPTFAAEFDNYKFRSAWATTNVYMLGRFTKGVGADASLLDAEEWFLGANRGALPSLVAHLREGACREAVLQLSHLSFDDDFLDLLPYILEPHGPGTRLSVMRDPLTAASRDAKKREGVFYTPADVAEYMVERAWALRESHLDFPRCLDPACGSGVFLRACLRHAARLNQAAKYDRLDLAMTTCYGIDTSPLAIESCAFVLLFDCVTDAIQRKLTPWSSWHLLRLNLAVADSLLLTEPALELNEPGRELDRSHIRRALLDPSREVPGPSGGTAATGRITAESSSELDSHSSGMAASVLFPEVRGGFDLVVGNPPYCRLGPRRDWSSLAHAYHSLRGIPQNSNVNTFLLFVEMMWRLTKPGLNTAALVVPLAIAYHQGRQYRDCRQAMSLSGGRWETAFFDREPHALFGEDVKTRNAILFRVESTVAPMRGSRADFATGPLRKWTSRTRNRLFHSIEFWPLGRMPLENGLPKLGSEAEALAFAHLSRRHDMLATLAQTIRRVQHKELPRLVDLPVVCVGGTAYNFLNVFRPQDEVLGDGQPLTSSSFICLEFSQERLACLVLAVLSSRLTYWLWRVKGDGFHVSKSFIEDVPFGPFSFTEEQAERLSRHGANLWTALQEHRILSVNGGKWSVAYRPLAVETEREKIDRIIVTAAGLPESFVGFLGEFVRRTVVVDELDQGRKRLHTYAVSPEGATR
jgi:N-6 DNA Methylase